MNIKIIYGIYIYDKSLNGIGFFFRRKRRKTDPHKEISEYFIPSKFRERIIKSYVLRNMNKKDFPDKLEKLDNVQFAYGYGDEPFLRIHALAIVHSTDHFSFREGRGKIFHKIGYRDKNDPTVLFEEMDEDGLSCGFLEKKPKKRRKKKKKLSLDEKQTKDFKSGKKVLLNKKQSEDLVDEVMNSISEVREEKENDEKTKKD